MQTPNPNAHPCSHNPLWLRPPVYGAGVQVAEDPFSSHWGSPLELQGVVQAVLLIQVRMRHMHSGPAELGCRA